MVTPYFSKLCHGHPCLLKRPTRIVDQRTKVHKTLNYFTTAY
ncbi:unnamed protein product [Callosobruchus maculatus]|uniref:Uncharacterized protein n=1 Tax=Callosobruchus maculatus TaxID=64391 RepID=A0A653CRW0_CALMS|nr:unnamed protein product [Callosobruchus maculatus]